LEKGGYVYIVANKNNTVLYVGVTNNLKRRVLEHREKINPKSFTSRYNIDKLLYYEGFQSITDAISREKQLKAGSRQKKIELIIELNKDWIDLLQSIND
jgi:putative endonuclease